MKKAIFLCGLILQASCEIEDDFGQPDRSEQLGELVYTGQPVDGYISQLGWSEASDELLFFGGSSLKAVAIHAPTTRVIVGSVSIYPYFSWISGQYMFYGDGQYLQRADIHVRSVETAPSVSGLGSPTAISKDWAAFVDYSESDSVSAHSIILLDLATLNTKQADAGEPLSFSPDGKKLLFRRGEPPHFDTYWILEIASGTVSSLVVPTQVFILSYEKIFWTESGIFHVQDVWNQNQRSMRVTNIETGSVMEQEAGLVAVSPSRGSLLVSKAECLTSSCYEYRTRWFETDWSFMELKEVANGFSLDVLPTIAYSPDERRIAYVHRGNTIYLLNLE